jgi:aminocarboxymuconate-semialdehyde decarboxylase
MVKIDMHTHILPEKLPDFAQKFGYGDFVHLVHHTAGRAKMMKGNTFFREIEANCWNPELRIGEYKQHGVQMQVVCTIPVMFSYWAKPIDCLELSKFLNDHIAQLVNDFPNHYLGLGTVPMQDAGCAIQELERCKSIGLSGIQIGSNINDRNLNEADFFPIFKACSDLDMALFVHPWNMMGEADMRRYWLPWLVGMPAETTRAICSMVFGGVLERLPSLRVCFAHAGGSFIPTIGRISHGYNCRPDLVAIDNPVPPQNYLGRFWIDCITHDSNLLQYIIDIIGHEKVLLGSDYPFPLGDLEIGAFLNKMGLAEEVIDDICHRNILEWLGHDKN